MTEKVLQACFSDLYMKVVDGNDLRGIPRDMTALRLGGQTDDVAGAIFSLDEVVS
jgi:hypothetical protein